MNRTSLLIVLALFGLQLTNVDAQLIRAPLNDGFVRTTSISVTVDEMLGSSKERGGDDPILGPGFPDLRIAEIQYKPVRFVRMPVTDPKTGRTADEIVWYMVFRTIARDCTELAGESRDDLLTKLDDPDLKPQNEIDIINVSPLLIPSFTLTTNDNGPTQTFEDEVNPQIQAYVFDREFGDQAGQLKLLNTVEAIESVEEMVSVTEIDSLAKAKYGVAIWRNVDPDTDYFTIKMAGFSNAYRIRNADGQLVFEEKVVEQRFGRPGDRYNQDEAEFRVIGDPEWKYAARKPGKTPPNYEAILRNNRSAASADAGAEE